MKSHILFGIFTLVLYTAVVATQNPALSATPLRHELHLKEAIKTALKQNPDLKSEIGKLQIEENQLKQAKRFFRQNPELSIEADYRKRKLPSPSGDSGTDFEVRLFQEIELSGQRSHRMGAAEKYLNAARWRISETERQLRLKVSRLFYELQTLQEKTKIQSRRLMLHESLFKAGQKRFQQEDISVLEIDTLRFDRDQAQHDLSKLLEEKLNLEKSLRALLGMGEEAELVATGTLLPEGNSKKGLSLPLQELKTCAFEHRPDLKALQAALQGDDASLQLETSKKIPNLAFGPLFKSDNEDTVIGASLMIPLPFFNRNLEAVTKARVQFDLKKMALDEKKREIQREVATAYRVLQLAKNQFERYNEGYLEHLKKRTTFPQKAYRAGEISSFEFSVAQGRLTEAQIRYLDVLLALLKARAELEAQTGYCGNRPH